jgi:hypothetical protein
MEALLWVKRGRDLREQQRQEMEYRALARQVARAHFSDARPDGSWDYYESMERWFESGAFSLSGSRLEPERDRATFNGSRWVLAQRNHGIDPDEPDLTSERYQAALQEYAADAIGPEFLWSWRNAQLEWDLYRRVINKRNDAARAVGMDVTLLLANHVLSTIDAFASYRIRVGVAGANGVGIAATIPTRR